MKYSLLLLILLASCSKLSLNMDGDLNDYEKISSSVKSKIEKMQIDSAIDEYEKAKKNGKKWCFSRYPSNNRCRQKMNKVPKFLVEEIENARKCKVSLNNCNEFSGLRREDLKDCIKELKNNCKVKDKWDTSYPNAYNKLVDNIEAEIPKAKLGSVKMSKAEILKVDQCQKNWIWSFNKRKNKYTKEMAFYAHGTSSHAIAGKFNSLQACEVERKNTHINFRKGLYDKDKCFKRYAGNDKNFCNKYL